MNNKKLYKDTFDEITMSEEAFGKVRNMKIEGKKTKRKLCFRFATVLAALVVVFALSNGIAYAATGSSLIEKAVDIWYEDENGMIVEMYIDGEKQENISSDIEKSGHYEWIYENGVKQEMDISYAYVGKVKEIDGRVYLILGDNEKRFDITEDFKDGEAEVEVECFGNTLLYTVEGTVEDNDINIQNLTIE